MGSPGLRVNRLCDDNRNLVGMSGNLSKIKGLFEDDVCKKSRSEIKNSNVKVKIDLFEGDYYEKVTEC